MYLLDTNILIVAIRHPAAECTKKLASHLGKDVCISVITYAELEYGILNSSNPDRNREAVRHILAGIPILSFGIKEAQTFGSILAELKADNKMKQNQDRDKMIAAHARANGYTLVTANTKDFKDIRGLKFESWIEPGDTDNHKI